MKKTLAARHYRPHEALKLEEVQLPEVGDDDVLIDTKATGICHSDLHAINGLYPPLNLPPITLGHELSGLVAEKGRNVRKVEVGDRVGVVDTVKKAIGCVKKGGKAAIVGMCFESVPISILNEVMMPEIKMMAPTDHLKSEIPQVLKFIENGRFDLSHAVSHKLPLKEVNKRVQVLNERIGNPVRVVLEP